MKKQLAAHPLEVVLLIVAAGALAVTMFATVEITRNNNVDAQDLTFAGTLRELSLLLQSGDRDRLARLDRSTLRVGNEAIAVDTITLMPTPSQEPSVAMGGFIADQATLFNDHSIRRAVIESLIADSRSRTNDQAPSVFRTVVSEDGRRMLSDQPNLAALTVRSPYAERSWHDVHTSDWRRSGGMLGLTGDISLAPDVADRSRSSLNGHNCVVRNTKGRLLLYCRSDLGADVDKFFDVGFIVDTSSTALGLRSMFTDRPGDLWRNSDKRSVNRADVTAGDVFDLRAVGPFVLSVAERGTLAATQWVNGRYTFTNQQLGTIGFFGAVGRSNQSNRVTPLVLSLDAALSIDLEAEARGFLATHTRLRSMSVVVMDARTGELRAIVEPTRTSVNEPLFAFEPTLVGSVVKPVVAASIIARRPDLARLTLDYAGAVVNNVAGVPLKSGFANSVNASGCAGRIGFGDFIRCSSNQYAAELLVRSLLADGFRPRADGLVTKEVLEHSAVGSGLAEVFDVDAFARRTAGRNFSLWTDLSAQTGGTSLTQNRALSPWESRPWIVFPQGDGTPVDWLARYAFGGWENRWTLMDIAQAYARIATGRAVKATILSEQNATADLAQGGTVSQNIQDAFREVRPALRHVPLDGTAAGLTPRLVSTTQPGVSVLAKTGTLNEETDQFKALAVAIGRPTSAQESAELSCGLVAVSYFEFADTHRQDVAKTPLPSVHLEFARQGFATVLQRHWDRLSGCSMPTHGTQP